MSSVRSLLRRVHKLEAVKKASPLLAMVGGEAGWAALEAQVAAGMADGTYDRSDMPVVMHCLRRWAAASMR